MGDKTVLFWGRTNREYSRNRILLDLFFRLGWSVDYFHPFNSQAGLLQSLIVPPERPDLIWVPCFRHSDIASASYWAKKWQVPLIVDPFISAYGKKVLEREKWQEQSRRAERLKKWETDLLGKADVVIADTSSHAAFFEKALNVSPQKTAVIYVGAEDTMFTAQPFPEPEEQYDILFYGSFLKLHGAETIVQAAERCADLNARWTLLGDSGLQNEIAKSSSPHNNICYEPWVPYDQLPGRIAKSHISLGIFGSSFQAGNVIPNKVFQSMAIGRPLITRYCPAYDDNIGKSDVIGWVGSDDPVGLADAVRTWLEKPEKLAERGRQTRLLYEHFFVREKLSEMLEKALSKVDLA
jgi:glycosyltransferase involved in cell wall biosynthesis